MTKLYLIRHAQAQGNLENRFQGLTDRDLTPLGHQQIGRLAERFRDVPLNAVYTSPLKRTQGTAAGVVRYNGLTPAVEPGIIEINGGIFEDMLIDDLCTKEPYMSFFRLYRENPGEFQGADGGESFYQVHDRMAQAVDAIAAAHPNQEVAVVSHGCAIRCYLTYAAGLEVPDYLQIPPLDNTAVSCVIYQDDGTISVEYMNDSSHLPEEEKSLASSVLRPFREVSCK
ncbi:histidine phosphatase family protein [Oscillospiraceae bacterium MB08-C2-2]|nr:histidine phosphatase family protein [Oscillospiraceae bacterium MB08-C2-2]